MKILQKNQDKVVNTKELLIQIINDPKNYSTPEIQNALMSQRKLAAFFNKEYAITSCTLNTLKSAADYCLSRGFIELDELRQNAKAALEKEIVKESKPNHNTKAYFKERLKNAEIELDKSKHTIMSLTTIIGEMSLELARMANSNNMTNEGRQALYQDLNNKLQHKLSFTLGSE